jgi:hypothetical protein
MYCNYSSLFASYLPTFGGGYGAGTNVDAFFLDVIYSAANSGATVGCRLMFL